MHLSPRVRETRQATRQVDAGSTTRRERKNAKWQCKLRQKRKPITVYVCLGEKVLNYLLLLQRRSNKRNKILIRTKNIHTGPWVETGLNVCVCVSHDRRMCGVCNKQDARMRQETARYGGGVEAPISVRMQLFCIVYIYT